MKLTRTVDCADAAGAIRDRLQKHLAVRGFRFIANQPGTIIEAGRGSRWGSLTSFAPKKWQARLRVLEPKDGTCRFECDINTTGQRVTASETAFWEAEAEGIASLIQSGDARLSDIDATSRKAAGRAIKLIFGYATLFGAVGLIIDLVGLRFGRHTLLAPIAAGAGAATGATRAMKSSETRK